MEENSVLIIGAGAAGLAAAEALSLAGVPMTVLEARDRIGGRIHTITSKTGNLPIELGAEFVHGEENNTWEIIRAAKLRTLKVPDRYWRLAQGVLVEDNRFWDELKQVFSRINLATPDQDLQSFLDQAWGLDRRTKKLAKEYVEGFHAAPADHMSIHALAKAEAAAERDKATHQFRIASGYSAMLTWFASRLAARKVPVWLNTVVKTVHWEPGQVEFLVQTPAGRRTFQAARALITLPLGVLKEPGPGAIAFEPKLALKEKALQGLGMGVVAKLTLQFRSRFWPVENFGLIHSDEAWLPTWWSDERGPLLTGWAGGPRAERITREGQATVLSEALRALSRLFKVELQRIQDLLVAGYTHDWTNDPFARGAYSYTPVRMGEMPQRLGAPMASTLFFAGEATDSNGEQGTVHGALASGERAAAEILDSLRQGLPLRPQFQEKN